MTLVVTHSKVSTKPVGNDTTRIYSDSWNANHTLTGTADASQLNSNVVQAVVNDTNIQGSIAGQILTLSWGGTLAAARLNANVVQAITNDTNVTGSVSAQNMTLGWTGQLGLARGGTNADLSATGGAGQYLKQVSSGAAVTVGTIPATDLASAAALTSSNDTNVTITLSGTPATSLLRATSLTMGWTGTLAIGRGGTGSGTQQGALNNIMPTPTRAGDISYWNGSNWVALAGNNSGTKVLQEDSSGNPSWATVAGTGTVTSFSSGNLSPLFTTSVATASTTPALSFSLTSANDKTILSNVSGGSAAPQYNNAASVGASWVLLQSQAASSSATIDFKDGTGGAVLNSTYDEYVVTMTGVIPATNAQNLTMQISTDAGSTWKSGASDYKYALNQLTDAGANSPTGSTGATAIAVSAGQSNNAGRPLGGNFYLFGPSASTLQAMNWQVSYFDGTNLKLLTGSGVYTGGAAINGLRFIFGSGNITSGTFTLYGIRKS